MYRLIFFALFFLYPSFSLAQQAKGGSGDQEIRLSAEDGLEWDSIAKTLTAEKKALATRGDTAIGADRMIAYYRELPENKTDIYLVKAKGNVIVSGPKQTVYANEAEYEIAKEVIILKGNPVKLVTGEEQMTAQRLELWRGKKLAIAQDNVVATKDARRLEAKRIKAHFAEKKEGNKSQAEGLEIEYFEAEENVTITNDKEKVTADYGVYWVDKETANLEGNVKISQGANFITGQVATINMKTGKSRLHSPSEQGKSKGQVEGVFVPDKSGKKKGEKAGQAPSFLPQKQNKNKESKQQHEGTISGKLLGEKRTSSD